MVDGLLPEAKTCLVKEVFDPYVVNAKEIRDAIMGPGYSTKYFFRVLSYSKVQVLDCTIRTTSNIGNISDTSQVEITIREAKQT